MQTTKKVLITIRKRQLKWVKGAIKKDGLEILTLTGHIVIKAKSESPT